MKTVPALGTSIVRPVGSGVVRVPRNLAFHLPETSSAVGETDAPCQTLRLTRGQVYRLDRASEVREIQVLDGTLWLTTTPADGDTILQTDSAYPVDYGWPVIIEALEDASIRLEPSK